MKLRRYFLLYFELMFQSPAFINNQRVGFEEVSKLNVKDLISNCICVGVGGYYDRLISLRLKVFFSSLSTVVYGLLVFLLCIIKSKISVFIKVSLYFFKTDVPNYKNLAKWTRIYLKSLIFESERISICAKKLFNIASEYKRDGNAVSGYILSHTTKKPGKK